MKIISRKFVATLALGVAAVLFAGPSVSQARTHVNHEARMAFEVPDDWKTEHEDDVFSAEAPNGQLHVIMHAMKGKNSLREAVDQVDEALDESFRHVKTVGETEEIELHGLKATQVKGRAMLGEEPIKWTAIVVEQGHRYLLVVAFGTEEGLDKHAEEAKVIFESIRPKIED